MTKGTLKFYLNESLVYVSISEVEEVLDKNRICYFISPSPMESFKMNRIEMYIHSKLVYWYSFQQFQEVSTKGVIRIGYKRPNNSLIFITED